MTFKECKCIGKRAESNGEIVVMQAKKWTVLGDFSIGVRDIIRFKTCLFNKIVEDTGIIESIEIEWGDVFVNVIPFSLKLRSIPLADYNEYVKIECIGHDDSYDFTNDETNHDFPIGYEFKLKLTDELFNEIIDKVGYCYWNTADEMKSSYEECLKKSDILDCTVEQFEGPHVYKIHCSSHCFRISDELIRKFSI